MPHIGARKVGYCARQLYLDMVRAPKSKPDRATLKIFREGSAVEGMTIRYLRERQPGSLDIVGQQQRVGYGDVVHGKIDGRVGDVLIEIKSASAWKYKVLCKTGDISEYRDQVIFYADTGRFSKILIVIVDRDKAIAQGHVSEVLVVPILPDPDRALYLKDRAVSLQKNAEEDEIPSAEMPPHDIQCRFCDHSLTCSVIGR